MRSSALENFAEKYVIDGKPGIKPLDYFKEKGKLLLKFMRKHKNIKFRMILYCKMRIIERDKGLIFFNYHYKGFSSKTHPNIGSIDAKDILIITIKEILDEIHYAPMKDSGLTFDEVIRLEIHTVEYKPMKGSTYIPLPDFLMRKKAIINTENKDNKCFLWLFFVIFILFKKMHQEYQI